jgi:hypothetical protein
MGDDDYPAKRKNNQRSDSSVKAEFVTGLFGIIIALIGILPIDSPYSDDKQPTIYVIIQSIFDNDEDDIGDIAITQTVIAVQQTQTAMVATDTHSPTPIDTLTPSPTWTPTIITATPEGVPPSNTPIVVTSVPTAIVMTATEPVVSGIRGGELDAILGADNWFCYPDRRNGVGARTLPSGFTVQEPLSHINTPDGTYNIGETTFRATSANVELDGNIASSDECPDYQSQALTEWSNTPPDNISGYFDELFGVGHWRCDSEFTYYIIVRELSSDLYIEYPFTAVDTNDYIVKYGVGDIVPGGQWAAFWTFHIPRNQCP